MSSPALRSLRAALLPCAFALALIFAAGTSAAAPPAQQLKVDINVTVHNSEVGVSEETLNELVEELLEEAGIQVDEAGADSAAIDLKIDIYRQPTGKFKVVGDLDDHKDEDDAEEEEAEHEEMETDAQDQIDDLVRAIVKDFIKLIRQ